MTTRTSDLVLNTAASDKGTINADSGRQHDQHERQRTTSKSIVAVDAAGDLGVGANK
ncbi:hypothetical protein U1Q18_003219, partial [Sarracenia purpurea var. burkii]